MNTFRGVNLYFKSGVCKRRNGVERHKAAYLGVICCCLEHHYQNVFLLYYTGVAALISEADISKNQDNWRRRGEKDFSCGLNRANFFFCVYWFIRDLRLGPPA